MLRSFVIMMQSLFNVHFDDLEKLAGLYIFESPNLVDPAQHRICFGVP